MLMMDNSRVNKDWSKPLEDRLRYIQMGSI